MLFIHHKKDFKQVLNLKMQKALYLSITIYQIGAFILFFSSIPILAMEIDPYDCIAIEQAVWALHLHNQNNQQKKLDLSKSVIQKKPYWHVLLPSDVLHLPKSKSSTKGWKIHPFYGTTGMVVLGSKRLLYKSMLGFVAINKEKKIITIVCRGSQLLGDWINNLQFWATKSNLISYPGYIRAGYEFIFRQFIQSLDSTLTRCLTKIKNPASYTFLVVGHSLGGSLATLIAPYLAEHPFYKKFLKKNNTRLLTFATPIVGFSDNENNFSRWVQERIPYVKHFLRRSDFTSSSGRLIKLVWLHNKWFPNFVRALSPDSVGELIELPDYGVPWTQAWEAHNPDKYRKGIYEILGKGETYTPWMELMINRNLKKKNSVTRQKLV